MNYAIELRELIASTLVAAQDGEPEEDFLARAKAAEGKSMLAIRTIEGWEGESPKQFTAWSPYFPTGDVKAKLAIFDSAMKELRKTIADRERKNPTGASKPKSCIIGG